MNMMMSLKWTPLLITRSAIFPRRLITRMKVNTTRARKKSRTSSLSR